MVDNDDQAEQCIHGFVQQGYVVLSAVEQEATHRLATARLRHPDAVVCNLIFATCGIESEVVASAERVELFPGKWVTTATAESMVAMKILSATAKRPRDLGDLQAILRANPRRVVACHGDRAAAMASRMRSTATNGCYTTSAASSRAGRWWRRLPWPASRCTQREIRKNRGECFRPSPPHCRPWCKRRKESRRLGLLRAI
jgi:hypothetical protein